MIMIWFSDNVPETRSKIKENKIYWLQLLEISLLFVVDVNIYCVNLYEFAHSIFEMLIEIITSNNPNITINN